MLTRRMVLAATAGLALVATAAPASAQAWKTEYKELVFAIVPAENASGVTERYKPFTEYLTKELGVPVTLRVANDYAAVIEGQKAGNIHIGMYGPSAFARALMQGAKVDAMVMEVNADGTKGYYSVLYVKKDSPYQKIEDLKGKNLGLVDPNSTSGNNVPRFAMNKMGIDPEAYFSKVVFTGSHENAVIALGQGTVDGAFNWWNDADESNLKRMERKGMAKYDDYRIIFKSDQIVNSPMAIMSTLPADMQKTIKDAVVAFPTKDKAGFDKMTDGKARPWEPTTNDAYKPIIDLNKFVDDLRKKKAS